MPHPKERPGPWSRSSRRDFLMRSGGAALALSGAAPLLAACSNSTTSGAPASSGGEPVGPGGLPLARPDKRVTLPLWTRPDRVRHGARDRRRVHRLQLSGLHLRQAAQGLRQEVRRHGQGRAVRRHQLRDRQARLRRHLAGRHRHDAGQPRPGGRRQADPADQPRLHPEPEEERVAVAAEPVLRRRLALRRALHDVLDRHRLAHRPRQGGHRGDGQPLGHPLGVAGVQGQGRRAQRAARDDRDGAPAQGPHGRQHRGSQADRRGRGRPAGALRRSATCWSTTCSTRTSPRTRPG